MAKFKKASGYKAKEAPEVKQNAEDTEAPEYFQVLDLDAPEEDGGGVSFDIDEEETAAGPDEKPEESGPEDKPESPGPEENPEAPGPAEVPPQPGPQEAPAVEPRRVCGINGCTTWYDDPVIMKRHYQRQHGLYGPPNLNQPKPRNAETKLE